MNELASYTGLSLQELITLFVAICALFFSGWQLFTQKRHNKLSVKPHLTLQHEWKDGIRKVHLKNVGLGPAIICNHEFKYKKRVVPFDVTQHLDDLADDHLGPGYYSGGLAIHSSQVIDIGESIHLLGIYWHEQHNEHEAKNNVVAFLEEAELKVVYKSMYGQKQKLKSCLSNPNDYSIY